MKRVGGNERKLAVEDQLTESLPRKSLTILRATLAVVVVLTASLPLVITPSVAFGVQIPAATANACAAQGQGGIYVNPNNNPCTNAGAASGANQWLNAEGSIVGHEEGSVDVYYTIDVQSTPDVDFAIAQVNDTVLGYSPYTENADLYGDAYSLLTFFYGINGPVYTGTGGIPIEYSTYATTDSAGDDESGAQVIFEIEEYVPTGGMATLVYQTACSGGGCSGQSTFDVSGEVDSVPDTLYEVELYADCDPVANEFQGADDEYGSCSSLVDPVLQIAPSFAAANPGYTLALSPGLTGPPPSTVAEPSQLLFLGTGLLAMALLLRRRLANTETVKKCGVRTTRSMV
jgi:hypothetical protein